MSQPKSVTKSATAAARYIAIECIPDPISPLADAFVSGIKEVLSDEDRTDTVLERIRVRVARALEDSLAQGSAKGKALRWRSSPNLRHKKPARASCRPRTR
ncbi:MULTISPECIES: hypothetical protein [unclassified Variovorax]|uniref:hypothetical protein n=1 Tax=unclassified Variovorax TaxID=663243 RepID=UPI003F47F23D